MKKKNVKYEQGEYRELEDKTNQIDEENRRSERISKTRKRKFMKKIKFKYEFNFILTMLNFHRQKYEKKMKDRFSH